MYKVTTDNKGMCNNAQFIVVFDAAEPHLTAYSAITKDQLAVIIRFSTMLY